MQPIKLKEILEGVESGYICDALNASDNNKAEAARILGLNRSCLVMKLRKYFPSRLNPPYPKKKPKQQEKDE
jgi:DNA-binding NtrC family response regulator